MNQSTQHKKHLVRVSLPNSAEALLLFGRHDENLVFLQQLLTVTLTSHGEILTIAGAPAQVEFAQRLVQELLALARIGAPMRSNDIASVAALLRGKSRYTAAELYADRIDVFSRRRHIAPKTATQKQYIEAMRAHDLVFGIGPAGTGKTYLAMAMAIAALKQRTVERIVLTRPAVEAGEALGFLPGDLTEKIMPYLRPLYDALHDMIDANTLTQLTANGSIEIAPLAYMRGRTLNNSFIILDEAQNTTSEQMKMFLTRLGFDSQAVVNGDITQIDLPGHKHSGLVQAQHILKSVAGIEFVYFDERDVVRHTLVQKIISAYGRHEQRAPESKPA